MQSSKKSCQNLRKRVLIDPMDHVISPISPISGIEEQDHGVSPTTIPRLSGTNYVNFLKSDAWSSLSGKESGANLALNTTREWCSTPTKYGSAVSKLSIRPFIGNLAETCEQPLSTRPRMTLELTDLGLWVGKYQSPSGQLSTAILDTGSPLCFNRFARSGTIDWSTGFSSSEEESEKPHSPSTSQSSTEHSYSEVVDLTLSSGSESGSDRMENYDAQCSTLLDLSKDSSPTKRLKRSRTVSSIRRSTSQKW